MIAEPYICYKGPKAGEITWQANDEFKYTAYQTVSQPNAWQLYADFEREKLKDLGAEGITLGAGGYELWVRNDDDDVWRGNVCGWTDSSEEIDYGRSDYEDDTESNRLLKRAEFLKVLCEKEGIEWLPKDTPQDLPFPDEEECSCFRLHGHRVESYLCTIHGDKEPKGGYLIPDGISAEDHEKIVAGLVKLTAKPERDTYTKEQIDKRIEGLINLIAIACPLDSYETFKDCRESFRDHFLY